ncbi:hypothetical protein ACB092_05G015900 [Castanea dentata]
MAGELPNSKLLADEVSMSIEVLESISAWIRDAKKVKDKTVLSLEVGKLRRATAKLQRFENFEEELEAISDKNQQWEMISNVWVEMLAYAACHCRGNYHAQ